MRKTIVATLCVALALCVSTQFVNADTENVEILNYRVETKGKDTNLWSVANITPSGYINGSGTDYANRTKFDAAYLRFDSETGISGVTNWGGVTQLSQSNNGWKWNDNSGWITPTGSTNQGFNTNGFYAYRLVFDAAMSGDFWANFTATVYADDYVVGIFLNGVEMDAETVAANQTDSWKLGTTVNFSYSAEVPFHKENNELILVVHNNRQYKNEDENATGLNAIVNIESNAEITIQEPDTGGENTTTPEPATMLILGLGTLGAGIYGRRRFQK